jgi:hypothetical protein
LRGTSSCQRIVLTDRVSGVNGTATLRNQEATAYTVVVFARTRALDLPPRYLRTARADTRAGSCCGLPGGRPYLVAALDYVEGRVAGSEFLERLRESASRLALRDGRPNSGAQSHRTLRRGALTLKHIA